MQRTSWDEVPLILNTTEVSELIGCSSQVVRGLCHTNQIPFIRYGRAFIFPRDRIRSWLDKQATINYRGRMQEV